VKISPDGEYLAASAIVRDKAVLALIHLSDMKGVNVVPRDKDELAGFWWVAPRRVMYTVGHKVGGLEIPAPTGELYTVAADGSDERLIFGYRAGSPEIAASHIARATGEFAYGELISPLRDDASRALIASYPLIASTSGQTLIEPSMLMLPVLGCSRHRIWMATTVVIPAAIANGAVPLQVVTPSLAVAVMPSE